MELQDYLISQTTITRHKADIIASHFTEEVLGKNTQLVQAGKVSKRSYFIQEGIARCYLYDHHGKEITTRFYSSPDFLNDFLSYFKRQPSEEYYETLTPCKVWTIDRNSADYCFHNIPEFREWGRMMLTMNYVAMHRHMISFHKQDAKERYLELLKTRPEIIQGVALTQIASYLGITKHSLSRIRKEITLNQ